MMPPHQQLRQKYESVLHHLNTKSIEIDGKSHPISSLLERGDALPVFQFQSGGNALASTADYYLGAR